MVTREVRRDEVLERMADHVLREGLAAASLRPLAAAAGTSDRMLLYYFADKNELLAATLTRVAHRLAAQLAALGAGDAPRSADVLLADLLALVRSPALRPFMQLWLELAAAAGRGVEPHRGIAQAIAGGFLDWIAVRIDTPDAPTRRREAARLLATIEGVVLLEAVGLAAVAEDALASPAGPER